MNTSQFPNGGWVFHQPQTGWNAPTPVASTFDQTVKLIIKHRQANPAIVAKHKLSTDPAVVSQELIKFQQIRGALPPDPIPKLTPPVSTPRMAGAVREAVAAVRKVAAGAALLFEWEEAGMPHVEQSLADTRSETCSTCPKNEKGKNLTDIFTVPVADMIKKKMERLEQSNLRTKHDSQLAVCSACLCPMRTKVWIGLDLILNRMKPETLAELNQTNPRCWILQESESPIPLSAPDPSPVTTAPDLLGAG